MLRLKLNHVSKRGPRCHEAAQVNSNVYIQENALLQLPWWKQWYESINNVSAGRSRMCLVGYTMQFYGGVYVVPFCQQINMNTTSSWEKPGNCFSTKIVYQDIGIAIMKIEHSHNHKDETVLRILTTVLSLLLYKGNRPISQIPPWIRKNISQCTIL